MNTAVNTKLSEIQTYLEAYLADLILEVVKQMKKEQSASMTRGILEMIDRLEDEPF